MTRRQSHLLLVISLVAVVLTPPVSARLSHISTPSPAHNIIVPQSRRHAFSPDHGKAVEITDVAVSIDILESTATTTIEIRLLNTTNRRQEAELILPVPDGAVIRGFAYDGPNGQITAKVLPKDEAKRIYQSLVSQIRDPALVEFIGYNLIRSSVFPIEPRGKQRLRLTYEHLLEADGNRIDYYLPRTESLEYAVPWTITAEIKAKRPISTVYSASHDLSIKRSGEKHVTATISTAAASNPGPFRLSYLLAEDGVTASMFAYPDEKVGGGYFLLLAGLPAKLSAADVGIKREVTIVIDRSGSMRNEKIEQVKEAALQIISGLANGEAFNVIIYNNTVQFFSEKPVVKNKETAAAAQLYIEGITATGGTNIHDALSQALGQAPAKDMLPIVLFLTDGLPTVGNTSEVAIRNIVAKSNPHKRRVFTFGVGFDINAPLLEKIADDSRGRAEFVLPKEDVEVKVGKVFKQLTGPVLAEPKLEVLDKDGEPALGRTRDIMPHRLPDMFEGDRLILLGQYVGRKPITFRITGNYLGKQRSFKFAFNFKKSNVKNGFVPRLWASRKIAEMIDAVRQAGAVPGASTNDPKIKELVDEIIRLSTEFGILTEYTAFLAREGTDLTDHNHIRRETSDSLQERAIGTRSGPAAVNQSYNMDFQKGQTTLNMRNDYYDEAMQRVSVSNVQQINDQVYYRRGNRWIDARLLSRADTTPVRTIEFGSDEFIKLAEILARDNRAGTIALAGDILLLIDSEPVLIRNAE